MRFSLTRKKCIWILTGLVACLLLAVLQFLRSRIGTSMDSQEMAKRWSEQKDVAQISCFFTSDAGVSLMQATSFGHNLDNTLVRESITSDSSNANARMWIDAYAAIDTLTLEREKNVVSVTAYGVGGEFFQFHPQKLISGYYFSTDDISTDYCIIDEDVAWQLFGAQDVAGMMVTISGKPYIVRAVIQREKGKLVEQAGLNGPMIFLPYEALQELTFSEPSLVYYEIVMPNPVTDYAVGKVKELFGMDESQMEVVENSNRFTFLSGVKTIGQFGYRSMQTKRIIYPYWENVARVAEDKNAVLVLAQIPVILYLIILVLGFIVAYYRHKTWTIESAWKNLGERIYDWQAKRANVKEKRENV